MLQKNIKEGYTCCYNVITSIAKRLTWEQTVFYKIKLYQRFFIIQTGAKLYKVYIVDDNST